MRNYAEELRMLQQYINVPEPNDETELIAVRVIHDFLAGVKSDFELLDMKLDELIATAENSRWEEQGREESERADQKAFRLSVERLLKMEDEVYKRLTSLKHQEHVRTQTDKGNKDLVKR